MEKLLQKYKGREDTLLQNLQNKYKVGQTTSLDKQSDTSASSSDPGEPSRRSSSSSSSSRSSSSSKPPLQMAACRWCERQFSKRSLAIHEKSCQKVQSQKQQQQEEVSEAPKKKVTSISLCETPSLRGVPGFAQLLLQLQPK